MKFVDIRMTVSLASYIVFAKKEIVYIPLPSNSSDITGPVQCAYARIVYEAAFEETPKSVDAELIDPGDARAIIEKRAEDLQSGEGSKRPVFQQVIRFGDKPFSDYNLSSVIVYATGEVYVTPLDEFCIKGTHLGRLCIVANLSSFLEQAEEYGPKQSVGRIVGVIMAVALLFILTGVFIICACCQPPVKDTSSRAAKRGKKVDGKSSQPSSSSPGGRSVVVQYAAKPLDAASMTAQTSRASGTKTPLGDSRVEVPNSESTTTGQTSGAPTPMGSRGVTPNSEYFSWSFPESQPPQDFESSASTSSSSQAA